MTHDDSICGCEKDGKMLEAASVPLGYDAGKLRDATCNCKCERCRSHRAIVGDIFGRETLRARLLKANIDPDDLANLVWHTFFSERIDVWMGNKIKDVVLEVLEQLRISSVVSITRESIYGVKRDSQKPGPSG